LVKVAERPYNILPGTKKKRRPGVETKGEGIKKIKKNVMRKGGNRMTQRESRLAMHCSRIARSFSKEKEGDKTKGGGKKNSLEESNLVEQGVRVRRNEMRDESFGKIRKTLGGIRRGKVGKTPNRKD